jgi:hypothetical protein
MYSGMDDALRDQHEKALKRLERFSTWTDSNFRVPFTRFRVGFGPLIALVPGIGDIVDLLMSLWVVNEARRIGASKGLIARMLGHLLVDFLGGLLPVVGDAFDVFYKANVRNTDLLREHLYGQLGRAPSAEFAGWKVVVFFVVTAILIAGGAAYFW